MTEWDVVIVGAGPAGSAAAYDLAAEGYRTLLLDTKEFPRFKPCAGGLTMKTLAKLRFSVSHLIHKQAYSLVVGYKTSKQRVLVSNMPICSFVVRKDFDQYCLEQAQNQRADFKLTKGVTKLESLDDHVRLSTADGEQIRTKFLIGADGAHSQIRKLSGTFKPNRKAVALEGFLPLESISDDFLEVANMMTIDFGAQVDGYGWLFPKKDHVNVGLYTYNPDNAKLSKTALNQYSRQKLGSDAFIGIHGYPIATGGESYQPSHDRILLVGDAAGMAEPLLGEGIHNAIATGQAVASSISLALKDNCSDMAAVEYTKRLQIIKKDILLSRRLAGLFYQFLPIAYPVLVRYPISTVLMNGFAAGMTLRECRNTLVRFSTQF